MFVGDLPESEVIRLLARISTTIGSKDRVLKLVCKNRHNVQVHRLSKEARGGQMRQELDEWHGKDWAVV